jgi:hypothetical protein
MFSQKDNYFAGVNEEIVSFSPYPGVVVVTEVGRRICAIRMYVWLLG